MGEQSGSGFVNVWGQSIVCDEGGQFCCRDWVMGVGTCFKFEGVINEPNATKSNQMKQ